jgi:NAD(P) transhydrogenase subunit beta
MMRLVGELAAVLATALFIFALYWMNDPKTARRGVIAGVTGMTVAILATWIQPEIIHHGWIVIAIAAGFLVGVPLARVPLTAVPQRTALSHAFGGLAAGLVGTAEFFLWTGQAGAGAAHAAQLTPFRTSALVLEVILGFLTFTGSLMAAGKLQEVRWIPQRPVTYPGQNIVNIGVLALAVGLGVVLVLNPDAEWSGKILIAIAALALIFGVLLIIPIGGADMPTVISILNAYAGLAAVAMGFVLDNKLLITAGALDGSSGLILSIIMCRAMNRSFTNVLFGAFGKAQPALAKGEEKAWKQETVEGASQLLEQARNVVIIPGYGMAVAQAQHKVRELYDALTKRGISVKFAIHPVAGRMPGHMNVLLAEANIPYSALVEMDEINPEMPQTDVALVLGANDVVNPAARYAKSTPIYGMPIIDADKAKTVLAVKRSKNPGFAGIDNELYVLDNTWMLFGDAKAVLADLVKQFGGGGLHG